MWPGGEGPIHTALLIPVSGYILIVHMKECVYDWESESECEKEGISSIAIPD